VNPVGSVVSALVGLAMALCLALWAVGAVILISAVWGAASVGELLVRGMRRVGSRR
jgi:hypothetical protein